MPNPDRRSVAWMKKLLDASSLSFTGIYVTAPPLPGEPFKTFTLNSRDPSPGDVREGVFWTAEAGNLVDGGWGLVPFYLSYSALQAPSLPSDLDDAALEDRGRLHGRHLRSALARFSPTLDGAVVFLDNEDNTDLGKDDPKRPARTELRRRNKLYLQAVTDGMTTPDPDLPAFRLGIYAHPELLIHLSSWPEVFLWDVTYDQDHTNVFEVETAPPSLLVNRERYKVGAGVIDLVGNDSGPWACIRALGRQAIRNYAALPPKTLETKTWPQQKTWDFDVSLVRNPAFPHAEPRLASVMLGSELYLVRSRYRTADEGGPPQAVLETITRPTMHVDRLAMAPEHQDVPHPEGPLVVGRKDGVCHVFSILASGQLAEWRTTYSSGLVGDPPVSEPMRIGNKARRLHAISVSEDIDDATSHERISLCYVDFANVLTLTERVGTVDWTDPVAVQAERVHPFSQIAITASASHTLIGYVNWSGAMAFTARARGSSTFQSTMLGGVPLLAGAVVCVGARFLPSVLQLAIGGDLRLNYGGMKMGVAVNMMPVGVTEDILAPTTGLGFAKANDESITVAAITDRGDLALYRFTLAANHWEPADREVIPSPAGGRPQSRLATAVWGLFGRMPARGWWINPFSDVTVTLDGEELIVHVAGTSESGAGLLRWSRSDGWEVYLR